MKSKLELVTGFLGAGKTAFINSYLKTEICNNSKILVVQLEKGKKTICSKSKFVKVISADNLENVSKVILDELEKCYYHKVLIEFNGTDKLDNIENTLNDKRFKERVKFYGNYYIGDSKTLDLYLNNMGELIIPFIQSSKLIIINNFQSIGVNERKKVKSLIEGINASSPIVYSNSLETLKDNLKSTSFFRFNIIENLIYKYTKGIMEE